MKKCTIKYMYARMKAVISRQKARIHGPLCFWSGRRCESTDGRILVHESLKGSNLRNYLTSHIRNCHQGKTLYISEFRGHEITQNDVRTRHLMDRVQIPIIYQRFKKEKKFKCEFCDYRGSCRGHVDRHMVVHTGLKPFKCQWCDYRSNQKQNTKNHEKLYCKYRTTDDG